MFIDMIMNNERVDKLFQLHYTNAQIKYNCLHKVYKENVLVHVKVFLVKFILNLCTECPKIMNVF